MRIALLRREGNTALQNVFCFAGARLTDKELGVHEVSGDIAGVEFEQFAEMDIRGRRFPGVHAFERQRVAGKGVVWFCAEDFFEHLTARFLLGLVHHLPYYSGLAVCAENSSEE